LRSDRTGFDQDLGLGGLQLVSLPEAREEAARLRKIARKGGDPLADRRKERRTVPTFEEAARKCAFSTAFDNQVRSLFFMRFRRNRRKRRHVRSIWRARDCRRC